MVERIPQHRHCKNCDKAVQVKDEFCDKDCEKSWKDKMHGKRRQLIYFYMLMVAIMIMAISLLYLG